MRNPYYNISRDAYYSWTRRSCCLGRKTQQTTTFVQAWPALVQMMSRRDLIYPRLRSVVRESELCCENTLSVESANNRFHISQDVLWVTDFAINDKIREKALRLSFLLRRHIKNFTAGGQHWKASLPFSRPWCDQSLPVLAHTLYEVTCSCDIFSVDACLRSA